jgi:hypothetical protein
MVAAALLIVMPVLAADGDSQAVAPLPELLGQMARGVATGAVIAFLFERFTFFQKLGADTKWWFVFLSSLILPLLAQLALQFVPAEVWGVVEPYWQAIGYGFVTWAGSQYVHKQTKSDLPF